ncbi:hypothetical protein GCM10010211_44570 [Streptomyces albospinus]|uniref:AAA+ ATPase domain-containing protein n=1 Tax=Streptomyces albospinus TaxID=285515 RepID=A0ABQ2V835_9ACTN|nr:hypothetical protein [Streptomyces albospinus]GGU73668.1 hypothetical protein GCM10010211_44570 [Streptomyces albospinus]
MPLNEAEWFAVTNWLAQYLFLDTDHPRTELLNYGFSEEFVTALPITTVSAENARSLVRAARRNIRQQVELLKVVNHLDQLSTLPEIGTAREFLHRLQEDLEIHARQDTFRTCVLKNGTEAFIDRKELRETLRRFVDDREKFVLAVDGDPGSGRSYTYTFLRHIAQHSGFHPVRVVLSHTSTASQVIRRLAAFLSDPHTGAQPFDPTQLNDLLPAIDDAVHWVIGQATAADEHYWLVLDECDKLDPRSDVWDFIGQLALAIYEHAAVRGDQAPRLVLLGYGRSMYQLPYDLRGSLCWDTARVVERQDLHSFFDQYFHESPPRLTDTAQPEESVIAGLVDEAVDAVLQDSRARDDDGDSYMRKICTAAEKAIRVYQTL